MLFYAHKHKLTALTHIRYTVFTKRLCSILHFIEWLLVAYTWDCSMLQPKKKIAATKTAIDNKNTMIFWLNKKEKKTNEKSAAIEISNYHMPLCNVYTLYWIYNIVYTIYSDMQFMYCRKRCAQLALNR